MDNNSAAALAWEILFGEKFESVPDPNKPENTAYINALRKQRADALGAFAIGGGKVLFDEWKKKIRSETLGLLVIPENTLCGCPACMILREIQPRLKLILEVETILSDERNKTN